MHSLWSEQVRLPSFETLNRNISTDVLIIGGGMAGLLCARMLEDAGADYVLLEANTICSGVTCGTTAKITALHGLRCRDLIDRFGMDKARFYYEVNQQAVRQFELWCNAIDCEFRLQNAYVYTRGNKNAIAREAKALNQLGIRAEYTTDISLPFEAAAVGLRRQAQFNPLMFAADVARGLNVYEHSMVRKLHSHTAITDKGTVTAKKVIIATHFPFVNRCGGYFIKLYQSRSYVIALENAPTVNGMYLEAAPQGFSFRSCGRYLLMGGGDHRTGMNSGGWRELERKAHELFPGVRVSYRWAAQDCMTLDGIPYIGRYSPLMPDVYVATGFNKWGMTSSMVAAQLITEMIAGRERIWAEVFSPSRSILCPQLASNIGHTARDMVRFTRPRCPHMGCALRWNACERTWDCPCHGSRFDERGRLIDNPSKRGLRRG